MNAILTLSSVVFPLITLPYVTRVLGADGVGRVYFASSVIAFFAIFAEIGIPVYGIRACARVSDDREKLSQTACEILTVNVISCAAVYAVFALALNSVPGLAEDRELMLLMSSTMILNAAGAEWLYKALEKFTYITLRSIAFKIIAIIMMFLTVRSRSDYIIYGFITIFAASASNIVNVLCLHRYIERRPVSRHGLKRHLPAMLMLFALAAATTVYTNLDLAILDFMKGNAEAGLYGVSVKIKLVIVSLITSVSAVLLPRNSFYYEKDRKDDFFRLLSVTMNMVFTVSVPVACFFMICAEESILILAGDGFLRSVVPMMIIMPSVIFIGISNIIGMQMLVPTGREKAVVRAAVIGAAVDLFLNLMLIPHYASAGAAAATLSAEICVTLYMINASGRSRREIFGNISATSVMISAAASSAAAIMIKITVDGTLASLCLCAAVFFSLYAGLIFTFQKRHA